MPLQSLPMNKYFSPVTALLITLLSFHPFSGAVNKVNDGPYIFLKDSSLSIHWICNNKLTSESYEIAHFPLSLNYCDLNAKITNLNPVEDNQLVFEGDYQVAAFSDVHGQFDLMIALLTNNHIIDSQGNWAFGKGHLVITGDIFDRGNKVTQALWFLYYLEQQAEAKGGKVHLLLGNHEVMVLNGDLRYLHPMYVETVNLLNTPYEELYAKNSVLGAWLRTKPVLVKVNNMLFAHGGFHPTLAVNKVDLTTINTVFKQNLVKKELTAPREGFGEYLHKKDGVIWYRGYFKDNGASTKEIDLLLTHFQVNTLVVGHTSQKEIETRHQGKVIAIDASMKEGKYGEILFIDKDKKWRGTLQGDKKAL